MAILAALENLCQLPRLPQRFVLRNLHSALNAPFAFFRLDPCV